MSMTKEERAAFLQTGGVLLRTGLDRNNRPIVKKRTLKHDWHIHLTCPSQEEAMRVATLLCNNHPDKFKLDQ
jgi:hypothetical protein